MPHDVGVRAPPTRYARTVPCRFTVSQCRVDAGGSTACDGVEEAATKVALEMTLLLQADSAAQWATMTDPNAAVRLDPAATAAALDVLARLPGSGDLVASYREIVDLEAQAVAGDAWGGGTGPGARANALVAERYVDLGVGLSTLMEGAGC